MNKLPNLAKRGFTLIELLVVIAVLGILASVVLVAINPAERLAEATDSGTKSDVSQVATAVESCFTNNSGSYANCLDLGGLVTSGYLKLEPAGVLINPDTGTPANVAVSGPLNATSAGTCATQGYWVYCSEDGQSGFVCPAGGGAPVESADCP